MPPRPAPPVVLGAGCPAVTGVGVSGDAPATTIAAVADLAAALAAEPSHPRWCAP